MNRREVNIPRTFLIGVFRRSLYSSWRGSSLGRCQPTSTQALRDRWIKLSYLSSSLRSSRLQVARPVGVMPTIFRPSAVQIKWSAHFWFLGLIGRFLVELLDRFRLWSCSDVGCSEYKLRLSYRVHLTHLRTVALNGQLWSGLNSLVLRSGSIHIRIWLVVVQIFGFGWRPFSLGGKLGVNECKNLG